MVSFARRPAVGVRRAVVHADALRSFPALMMAALAAQLVVLLPVASTAYWGDDTANAYIRGYLRSVGRHWWPFIVTANNIQWQGFGRLMPLGVLQTYGAFYVLGDRATYKVFLIVITLVASAMLGLLVRRLGASAPLAALVAALPAVVWQFHLLHDPLISYTGLVQAVMIYLSAAMLMFVAWLRRGGWLRVAAVMVLTACACITYESAYLIVVAMVLVAWRERGCSIRRAIVLAAPGLAVAGAFVLVAAVRTLMLPSASGYHPSTSPGVILGAWVKIMASGLPLVGRLATPGPGMLAGAGWQGPILRGVFVAVVLFALLLAVARTDRPWLDRRTSLAVGGVGLVLVLASSLLTAVAPQYQQQVQWGWGYLPMFTVGLGWALLAALGVAWLLARLAGRLAVAVGVSAVLAAAFGAMAAVNGAANARVVRYMQPVSQSRDVLEDAFRLGVLDRVPTRSTVLWNLGDIVVPFGAWDPGEMDLAAWTREFVNRPLTMHILPDSDRKARVCTDSYDGTAPCRVLRTPTFWLRTGVTPSLAYVAVDRIGVGSWRASDDTTAAPTEPGSRPVVFVKGSGVGSGAPTFQVTVKAAGAAPTVIGPSRLQVVRRGAGWMLAELPPRPAFTAFSIQVSLRRSPRSPR